LSIVAPVQAAASHIQINPGSIFIQVYVNAHIRRGAINTRALTTSFPEPVNDRIFGQLRTIATMGNNGISTEEIYRKSTVFAEMTRPVNVFQLLIIVLLIIHPECRERI